VLRRAPAASDEGEDERARTVLHLAGRESGVNVGYGSRRAPAVEGVPCVGAARGSDPRGQHRHAPRVPLRRAGASAFGEDHAHEGVVGDGRRGVKAELQRGGDGVDADGARQHYVQGRRPTEPSPPGTFALLACADSVTATLVDAELPAL